MDMQFAFFHQIIIHL